MFGGIGMQEILLILFIFLLFFGAKRLPELAQALGKGIREFKRSVSDIEEEIKGEPARPRVADKTEPRRISDHSEPPPPESKVEIKHDSRSE